MTGTANDFTMTETSLGRAYNWPAHGFTVTAGEIRRNALGLYAEVTVQYGRGEQQGHVFWERLNLSRHDDKSRAVKFLSDFSKEHGQDGVPWERMFEVVRWDVRQAGRVGQPFVRLSTVKAGPMRWLISKIVPYGDPTVVFAGGGTGKSTLVAVLAVVAATGERIGPFSLVGSPTPVVILDWETTESEWSRRVDAICRGADIKPPDTIFYRPQSGALVDEIDGVRAKVEEEHAGLVVVDSLMGAYGGQVSPEFTTPFFNSLRSLPATPVIVHHLTKHDAQEHNGPPDMYGDVTITNRTRAAWALGREENDDKDLMELVMTNTKMNGAPIQQSLGMRLTHTATESDWYTIDVEQFDPLAAATLSSNLRLGDRIIADLRDEPRTEKDLLLSTGAARTTLQRNLERLVKRAMVVRDGGSRGGFGGKNAAVYRLPGTAPLSGNGHHASFDIRADDSIPF